MGFKRTWVALGGLCAEVHLVVKTALQYHPVLSLSEPSGETEAVGGAALAGKGS